ncbi:hypothetical protein CDV31_012011 [Fusarium ambrosium]|uniref:C2H2-type domain-containing protein n=1 Tax=Fusarium ambrosium TaxID=131363 RepID=A0A428TCY7_9HYPO|nr:hypothetical protein CDV31_012011 [Fusarium ambrosium]
MDRLEDEAESFRNMLNPSDREPFALTRLADMQMELHSIQTQRVDTKEMICMKRLQLFLDSMVDFEKTLVAIGFSEAKQAMAYLWASVRFLLKTTNPTEKAFDNVLDTYELLGVKLIKVSEYTNFFREVPAAQEYLVNIYKDIQTFHSLAYKLFFTFRPKLWQKLHKPIWKDLKSTFNHIAESLALHAKDIKQYGEPYRTNCRGYGDSVSDDISDSTVMVNPAEDVEKVLNGMHHYRFALRDLKRNFEEAETKRKVEMKTEVRNWISSSTKIEELQQKFSEARICKGSGRWLFKSYKRVSQWLKEGGGMEEDDEDNEESEDSGNNENINGNGGNGGNANSESNGTEVKKPRKKKPKRQTKGRLSQSALWIHGNRGFGKTILASLVVDELESIRKRGEIPEDSKTYYFYCQEEDVELQTYLGILKGILHQMVKQDDYIVPLCHDKMTQGGCDHLSNADTAKSLIETIVQYNPRQYIIIDGLDECKPIEIRQTAEFFTKLVDTCNNTNQERGQLRLMFMSQDLPEIKNYITEEDAEDAIIALKSTDNAEDIRAFVKKKLLDFRRSGESLGFNLEEEDRMQIESIICRRSEDSFLYAYLAMESLGLHQTKGELLQEIREEILPAQLWKMYEKLLGNLKDKIERETGGDRVWQKSKLLLGWLVCAKRPLKWHEMQAILSFDTQKAEVDFDNLMLKDNVRKYLGSLVHVLDGDHIRLIHTTAREFIVSNKYKNKYIKQNQVQCQLTSLCLRYLSLPSFTNSKDYESSERRKHAKFGWFSFQDYACSKWYSHMDTFIRECSDMFDPGVSEEGGEQGDFIAALQLFVDTHGEEIKAERHAKLEISHIKKFDKMPFYENLLMVWNHIYTHQQSKDEERNKVGIPQIDEALLQNRTAVEEYEPDEKVSGERYIKDFYGLNLYKCRRTLCRYFYVGYDTKAARKSHENRHDRPFPCEVKGCTSAPIGFSTNKDKDRHVRIYHPELSEGPTVFEALSRRQATGPARFTCHLCGKNFTRKINLSGHERSHYGDRPYKCSFCEKAFARMNDCRRHEKIHRKDR